MLFDLTWRLQRLMHQARRLATSVMVRGWRGTGRHLIKRMRATPMAFRGIGSWGARGPERPHCPRMLVLESSIPVPTRDSGSLRLHNLLQLLVQEGWQVELFCDDQRATREDLDRMAGIGVAVHNEAAARWLRRHGGTLQAAMVCRAPMAAQYSPLIRRYAPQAMLVFDTVDLHFLREQRAATAMGHAGALRRSARNRRRELQLVADSDLCLVVSSYERELLASELPGSRIEVLSNIHEIYGKSLDFESRRDLLFVGGFGHPPNEDAIAWFTRSVLPLLLMEEPSLKLHVVGDAPPESRAGLAHANVVFHGRIDDLSALMGACRVSVAPLRFGAGVKGKINMAMSYGLPVVATSIAAEGMHLIHGKNVLVADDPTDFAAAVLRAYRDHGLWQMLSDEGLINIETHFSTAVARATVHRLFPAKIGSGPSNASEI